MTEIPSLKKSDVICHSTGGIDLQINGALGIAFNELTPATAEYLPKICQFLWQQGIDGFLPTLVTTSVNNYYAALSAIQLAMQTMQAAGYGLHNGYSEILGVHLEGPFLHPDKRGAHPLEYLLPLNIEQIKRVISSHAAIIKLITIAPELDPAAEVIPFLLDRGITVSLGHSNATAAQARQAFHQGAKMLTHVYNAMPPMHHREPGLLGEALLEKDVWCGLIADGVHVHPQMVDLVFRLKCQSSNRNHKVILVSDALAPFGLAEGTYPWDDREIEVKNGVARLPNGTLSGTTRSLLDGVKNLVEWQICPPEQAIATATITPRQLLNLSVPKSPSLVWYWQSEGKLGWQRC